MSVVHEAVESARRMTADGRDQDPQEIALQLTSVNKKGDLAC